MFFGLLFIIFKNLFLFIDLFLIIILVKNFLFLFCFLIFNKVFKFVELINVVIYLLMKVFFILFLICINDLNIYLFNIIFIN